ncbi:hypothetical protein E3P77_00012 [Wallemia ichthyophaga]|nr:hypothetical protein E3P77_00012 [Wallemia ichthyophaga]
MSFIKYETNFNENELKGKTLILPSISIANVPQLAIELLLNNHSNELIGRFNNDGFIQVAGGSANGLVTPLELRRLQKCSDVFIIDQRSPILKSHKSTFVDNLKVWAERLELDVVVLSSADSAARSDNEIMSSQLKQLSNKEAKYDSRISVFEPLELGSANGSGLLKSYYTNMKKAWDFKRTWLGRCLFLVFSMSSLLLENYEYYDMPKKRSLKPVNRGFATTSVQKKPEDPKPVVEAPQAPAPEDRPSTPLSTSQQPINDDIVQQYYFKVLKDVERNVKGIDYDRKLAKQLPTLQLNDINYKEFVPTFSSDDSHIDSNDKIFHKLGVTYNTLKRLGFTHSLVVDSFNATNSFDLQNALVWLAFNVSDEQLNDTAYTTIPPSPPKPLPTPTPPASSTPKKTSGTASPSLTPSKPSKPALDVPQITLSDDDQLEPTQAYVRFKLELDDAERAAGIVKKKKKSKADDCSDPQVIALRAVVDQLQGMYLFDKKDADNAYREQRNELDKELLQERLKQPQPQHQQQPPSPTQENKKSADPVEEDMGDLFKEEEQEELTPSGNPMPVIDMTLPRQISARSMPKTIVEETIIKIDKSAQSYFMIVSKGSRAIRASGFVQWGLEFQYARDEHEMVDVGCQNDTQAINYVALMLLHKVYLKHPAACTFKHSQFPLSFQELWAEVENKRKTEESAKQSEEYLMLKQYFDEKMESAPSKYKSTPKATKTNATDGESLSHSQKNSVSRKDSKLQEIFEQRQRTEAYQTMLQSRNTLPIASYREEILNTINSSQVMVLSGETGCGKSTQLPAFILEDALSKGEKCKIYCTEPRRISAISLGSRVSAELGEKPGTLGGPESLVGYAVRLESHIGKSTRLVYATNGIALRMLESSNGPDGKSAFDDLTHIVIDEVHERSIESDFLLIVLKSLLQQRKNLKIILMSATVDSKKISSYFGGCPVISVPGRTFPVDVCYLEDAIEFSGFRIDETSQYARNQYDRIANKGKSQIAEWNEDEDDEENNSGTSTPKDQSVSSALPKLSPDTFTTLNLLNEYLIPYDLILKTLERLSTDAQWIHYSSATLIFMSGMAEIRRMNDMLQEHPLFGDSSQFNIYPLHSSIASDKQGAVFDIPPPGVRKIVIATNIAETGITIPDVTCVIDTGRHREMRFDEKRQISRLLDCFIAKSNAKQRRGRAGRVREGLCFHLFTRDRFENGLSDHPLPEMTRLSLQDLALRIKIMNVQIGSSIEDVLMRALDPPTSINIQRAISSLIEVKALKSNEEITPMGRILSRLPVDVHIGKFLLFAVIFGCLDSALTIAATLNSKSPFVTPFGHETEAMNAKKAYNEGSNSDFVIIVKAYNGWRQALKNQGWAFMKRYCDQNYLSLQNLQSIEELRIQLMSYLIDANFVSLNHKQMRELNAARMVRTGRGSLKFFDIPEELDYNAGDYSILHAAIAAGLFPKMISLDWYTKTMKTIQNNAVVSIHPSSPNFKVNAEGLSLLQHRGQDACGIITCGPRGRLNQVKSNGMVRDVFDNQAISTLRGCMGIGHVRYPTAGSSAQAEAQPFYVNSPYGITFAHNGNLINTEELKEFLDQDAHRHINTDSDSEMLLNIFADNLQQTGKFRINEEDIFTAVRDLTRTCKGAYACVAMIAGFGIVAFRDPNGIRPLGYGVRAAGEPVDGMKSPQGDKQKTGLDYVFASESVVCDALGFTDWVDVKPGECMIVTRHSVSRRQVAEPATFAPDIFEYVYFARPDSVLDGISVYRSRMGMGDTLADGVRKQLLDKSLPDSSSVDVVIPVPDTSRVAALQLAQNLRIPYREGFVKNRYVGRTFIMPGQQQRRKNVRRKLNAMALEFSGKNVLLVDDSIVRGTTSKEIIQMARDAGAKNVFMASCAPAIRYSNVYGIDMPNRKELVAHGRTEEQVAEYIGADKVIFQTLDGLVKSCSSLNEDIQHFDCSVFTGKYITGGVDVAYLEHLENLRADNVKNKVTTEEAVSPACSGPMNGADDNIGLANQRR